MATLTTAALTELLAELTAARTTLQRSVASAKGRATAAQNDLDRKNARLQQVDRAVAGIEAALAAVESDGDLAPDKPTP